MLFNENVIDEDNDLKSKESGWIKSLRSFGAVKQITNSAEGNHADKLVLVGLIGQE
jgi:hypothetical protein